MEGAELRDQTLNTFTMKLLGAIQAGGRSARMGTDKSWVELAGRPMIEYTLAAAQPLVQRLAIVISHDTASRERYERLAQKWQAVLLDDPHDHCGPLGGIHAALLACEVNETALILACDLPFVTTEFLAFLQAAHSANEPPALTIPLDQAGRRQMLAGYYQQSCLPTVEQMFADDVLRVDQLCLRLPARQIELASYAHLPRAGVLLDNLNTPEAFTSGHLLTKPETVC